MEFLGPILVGIGFVIAMIAWLISAKGMANDNSPRHVWVANHITALTFIMAGGIIMVLGIMITAVQILQNLSN